ncbi:MAG: hypothetical protein OXU45_09105 [Candidatus Melainabacteria bacterium]|nr:hypothetical protein [Candidatus Melainabacteria bacterium]
MNETKPAFVGQPGSGAVAWQDRVDTPDWEKTIVLERLAGLRGAERRAEMVKLQDELSNERRVRAKSVRVALEALSEPEMNSDETQLSAETQE